MRLTQCLRTQHIGWWFKQKWKMQGHRKIIEMQIPVQFPHENQEIVDGVEFLKSQEAPIPEFKVPEPWTIHKKLEGKDHPNWRDRVCLFFSSETNLLEGENHIQRLTKTVKFENKLPRNLQRIYDRLNIQHLDEVVQNFIRNSLLHDAYQKKIPRLVEKERLHFQHPIRWGIPNTRKCDLLLSSFLRMADMEAMKHDANNINRNTQFGVFAACPLEKDGHLIQYNTRAKAFVTAPTMLSSFANKDEVKATAQMELPDLYPLHYTLDLKPENVYESFDFFPIAPRPNPHFAHTLFINNTFNPDRWSRSQLLARAIGICHAFAIAQARALFGNDVAELPHPISLQCIQSDTRVFDFIAYQLNTMNHDGTDGIKNCVWVDDSNELFERCEKERLRDHFEGFNNDVVRKFLTFYLNGLKLD